jgi:hypothetical protein
VKEQELPAEILSPFIAFYYNGGEADVSPLRLSEDFRRFFDLSVNRLHQLFIF